MDLSVVLTSAAVSAVVSGLFTFVSQVLERKSRQRELLLKTATDWAVKHHEHMMQLSKDHGRGLNMPALGWLAHDYYHQLSTLLQGGTLPPAVQQQYEAWLQETSQPGRRDQHA